MKTYDMKFFLIVLLVIMHFSCDNKQGGNSNASAKQKHFLNSNPKTEDNEKIIKKDSLANIKILTDAVKLTSTINDLNHFSRKYEVVSEAEGNPIVKVEIDLIFFGKFSSHLIVRRKDPSTIYIDIFLKENERLKKLLSHEQWAMEYINDTVRDVNGDGYKDLIVNWYGSNGCCLKAFSNVYLYQPLKNTFAKNVEFINPTFSPKEGVIRGICYGHSGNTEMYKFKWNGEAIDTLEYVSYQYNKEGKKTGKVIISNTQPFLKGYNIFKILNTVPQEYHSIDGFDWFTGKGNSKRTI